MQASKYITTKEGSIQGLTQKFLCMVNASVSLAAVTEQLYGFDIICWYSVVQTTINRHGGELLLFWFLFDQVRVNDVIETLHFFFA